MLTEKGPKVVEYNARFGDPETQPILSMLDTDLLDIFQACVNGTLDQVDIKWKDGAACCIVLASGGYPIAHKTGYVISGLDKVEGAVVFHAGTKRNENGEIVNNGGRVLGVTAVADTLEDAVRIAYERADRVEFENAYCRRDIGARALAALK
jgi:phosphoribosylamine--glycine ligase